MDLLHWLVFGVLPALAATLLFVGAGGPRCLSLALAIAVCVPLGMANGWPAWPWLLDLVHGDPVQWLWWCLAFVGVVGAAYDWRLLPLPVLFLCDGLLVLMLPWLLSATLREDWSFERGVVLLGAAWIALVAVWWLLRQVAKVLPGAAVPLLGTLVLIADGLVLHAQGAHLAWRLAGVAAVALGVSVATTLWRRPFVCGAGGTLSITILHASALWAGRSEEQILSAASLLCLVAPLPMWLATLRWFRESRTTGAVVGIAAAVAVASWAIAIA